MKVIVMGAGIVGVTTAWSLAQAGFQVTLVDRQAKAANETSKGNAGILSVGHTEVWNKPSAPLVHLQSLFQKDPLSSATFLNNPGFMEWSMRFLKACQGDITKRNTLLTLQLGSRSAELTRDLINTHQLDVSMTTNGVLYWHSSKKGLEQEKKNCDLLNAQGLYARMLTLAELHDEEPALQNNQHTITGAMLVPKDFSASCPAFTQQLLELAIEQGNVTLLGEHTITSIEQNNRKITAIETSQGRLEADHFVMALGPESGLWANTIKLDIPIAPAKGYSLTVSVDPDIPSPTHAGIDISKGVAFSPVNNQLRITSYAKFDGFNRTWKDNNFKRHKDVIENAFPGLVLWHEERNEWAGLRPVTPDGIPVIGEARPYDNLWINTGHGSLGWTLAAASAEMLVQKMTGAVQTTYSKAFDHRW